MNKSDRRNMLALFNTLGGAGFSDEEIETLLRVARTLQLWGERECGSEFGAIERDADSWCDCGNCQVGRQYGENLGDPGVPCPNCGYPAPMRHKATGKAYWVNAMTGSRTPMQDREASAKRRLAKIMEAHPDWLAYHQTDCRGCNLYLLRKADLKAGENLDSVYNRGVAVCY